MPGTRECGVCWYVYSPEQGDDVWQVPAGTPFEALPGDWRCPRCDSGKDRFLPPRDEAADEPKRDARVAALVAAYERIHRTRMAGLPVVNAALRVEAVGFRPYEGGLLGALVTPWSINAIYLPPDGCVAPAQGHSRALPSGCYQFLPQRLEGVGLVELASLFSPALEFESHEAAVTAAAAAVEALLAPPEAPSAPERSRRELFDLLRPRPLAPDSGRGSG